METIKVSIDVNVNLSEDAKAFIKSLFGRAATNPNATSIEGIAVVEESRAMEKAAALAAPAPAPAAPAPAAPASSINIEDVREALAEKVNEHRAAIKGKLTELGAPSVTKLDPSKYEEMYNFLKSL